MSASSSSSSNKELKSVFADPNSSAFIVGTLKWKASKMLSEFSQQNRRDKTIVNSLKDLGMLPERISYLADENATGDRILSEFHKMLGRSKPGDCLLIYYCGHGVWDDAEKFVSFCAYDYDGKEGGNNHWNTDSIFSDLHSQFKGKQVYMLADCCHSGRLVDIAKSYEQQGKLNFGLCVMTSAIAQIISTGSWTFSDCFVECLRCDCAEDLDGDGIITLEEVMTQMCRSMTLVEGQLADYFTCCKSDKKCIMAVSNLSQEEKESKRQLKAKFPLYGHIVIAYDESKDSFEKGRAIAFNAEKDGVVRVLVRFFTYANEEVWIPSSLVFRVPEPTFVRGQKVRAVSPKVDSPYSDATVISCKNGGTLYFSCKYN
jgi:hypothetical protein